MKSTYPTVTIGIPTYEAGESLVAALHSIYRQSAANRITRILLVIDGKTLPVSIRKRIQHPTLRIVQRVKREGQSSRINDILRLARTDLVILTNDDVLWDRSALAALLAAYHTGGADLFCSTMAPLPTRSLVSYCLEPGVAMTQSIARRWNDGDNYLSCNGRLIALSRRLATIIRLPTGLWNNDAYIYLRTKQAGYHCRLVESARCLYKAPETLHEHIRQTRKFRRSHTENSQYLSDEMGDRYHIPAALQVTELVRTFLHSPVATLGYMALTVVLAVYFFLIPPVASSVPYWETDPTTKRLTGEVV